MANREAIKTKWWVELQNAILDAKSPEEKAEIYSLLFPEEQRDDVYKQFLWTIEDLRKKGKIKSN